jgi:putative flippase GtrA
MASRAEFGGVLPFAGLWSDVVDRFLETRRRIRARHPVATQLARFAVVGGLGTAANAVFYLTLRLVLDTVPANLVALLVSTALSTEINRRFVFDGVQAPQRWRVWVQDLGTVVFYAGYSTGVLLLLHEIVTGATPLEETAAVTVASVLGGLIRFLVLKAWVFHKPHGYGAEHAGDVRPADPERGTDPRDAERGGATAAPAARVPAEPRDVGAGRAGAGV